MQRRIQTLLAWLVVLVAACGDNLTGGEGGDDDNTPPIDSSNSDTGGDLDAPIDGSSGMPGVVCGAATCTTGMECCFQGMNRTCVAAGSCNGLNFDCDDQADCTVAGEVCCSGGGSGNTGGTTCTASASCPMPTCGDAADCPAGQNLLCCALGPVNVCLAQCPGP